MFQEQTISANGITINYAEGPQSGETLVLLHGGSGRWQGFGGIIDDLAVQWHIVAPDFRGHGKSSHTPGQYRMQDYADDMAGFFRQRFTEPVSIFGHSLGGEVAIMLAAQQPELVRAIIIGDSPLSHDNMRAHFARNRGMTTVWRDLAASGKSVEEIAAALRQHPVIWQEHKTPVPAVTIFGEDHPWFSYMAETLRQHDPNMLTALLDHFDNTFASFDVDTLFPAIHCPVLILQGDPDHGGLLTDTEAAHALSLMPHAKHICFEKIGHGLYSDQKAPVLDAINGFLLKLIRNTT